MSNADIVSQSSSIVTFRNRTKTFNVHHLSHWTLNHVITHCTVFDIVSLVRTCKALHNMESVLFIQLKTIKLFSKNHFTRKHFNIFSLFKKVASLQYLYIDPSCKLLAFSIKKLVDSCPSLRHFDFTSYIITDQGLVMMAERCPLLKHLNINTYKLTDDSIVTLTKCCKQLEHLNIVSPSARLTDVSMNAVADYCPSIKHLNLNSHQLTDPSIINFSQKCVSTKHLNVSTCRSVTDASMTKLAKNCPSLEHIGVYRLTNVFVLALSQYCPLLKHISGQSCRDLVDTSMIQLFQKCNITHLTICQCNKLTDAFINSLAKSCRQLKHLNIGRKFDRDTFSIRSLGQHCHSLLYLDCSNIQLEDESVLSIADSCHSLQHLNLQNCMRLTDASMLSIAHQCPSLEYLNVYFCFRLTDASIQSLAKNCQLKHITVSSCIEITGVSIIAIATHCPELISLDVSHCNSLTDVSIVAVSTGCKLLKYLNIKDCISLTDYVVGTCDEYFSSLLTITISYSQFMEAKIHKNPSAYTRLHPLQLIKTCYLYQRVDLRKLHLTMYR